MFLISLLFIYTASLFLCHVMVILHYNCYKKVTWSTSCIKKYIWNLLFFLKFDWNHLVVLFLYINFRIILSNFIRNWKKKILIGIILRYVNFERSLYCWDFAYVSTTLALSTSDCSPLPLTVDGNSYSSSFLNECCSNFIIIWQIYF